MPALFLHTKFEAARVRQTVTQLKRAIKEDQRDAGTVCSQVSQALIAHPDANSTRAHARAPCCRARELTRTRAAQSSR